MTNWTREQQDVHNALQADGITFRFSRKENSGFDPIAGTYTATEDHTFTLPGFLRTPSGATAETWQTQGLIRTGDEMLLVACGPEESDLPQLEDRVDISGQSWTVKGRSLTRPGLVPLLCRLLVRRV